jgi:hypothetical protein
VFFDELPTGQTVEIHGLYLDFLPRWWNTKEIALVRSSHSEACSYFVTFGNHLFQRPLDIRESPTHHPDDGELASRTAQRLGASRNIDNRGTDGTFPDSPTCCVE